MLDEHAKLVWKGKRTSKLEALAEALRRHRPGAAAGKAGEGTADAVAASGAAGARHPGVVSRFDGPVDQIRMCSRRLVCGPARQLLMTSPGVGPIIAMSLGATVGGARESPLLAAQWASYSA